MENNWISVKEKLPKQDMKVRWKCDNGHEDIGFCYTDGKTFATFDISNSSEIIAWMPLPERPKE